MINAVLKIYKTEVPVGENWSITVPEGKLWYVVSIGAQLNKPVESASRFVSFYIVDPDGAVLMVQQTAVPQSLPEVGYTVVSNGIPQQGDSGSCAIQFGGLPKDFPVTSGCEVVGWIDPVAEGDQWLSPTVLVYEVSVN